MKFHLLAIFIATVFQVNEGKKLRLLAGVNGGVLSGVNPGLLAGGAGFIGQPQFAQMVPGVPGFGFMQPQAFPAGPFGFPNTGLPPQQLPGQYQYPVPPVNGMLYPGFPQMAGMNPPQQQVMGGQGAGGNNAQQQSPQQPEPARRFKRFLMTKAQALKINPDAQTQTVSPTLSPTETNKLSCL